MAAIATLSAVAPVTVKASFTGKSLKSNVSAGSSFAAKTVSNGSRVSCMKVWTPVNNPRFETLSYLPPLTVDDVIKQIDYMLSKGWFPCIEFDLTGVISREYNASPGYYDGRYWTMWKLPMFGCTDGYQVAREISECKNAYPDAYIRVLGFDNIKQVQTVSFIVNKPYRR
jgi:ribulose-bisphosphate carboxylase small chain